MTISVARESASLKFSFPIGNHVMMKVLSVWVCSREVQRAMPSIRAAATARYSMSFNLLISFQQCCKHVIFWHLEEILELIYSSINSVSSPNTALTQYSKRIKKFNIYLWKDLSHLKFTKNVLTANIKLVEFSYG